VRPLEAPNLRGLMHWVDH